MSATRVTFANASKLTCVTPANPPGACNVTVTNTDGQQGSLPSGFTYQ